MQKAAQYLKADSTACMLWISASFSLTSAVYLAWVSRLVALAGAAQTDWLSMVAGYSLQAVGIGLDSLMRKRLKEVPFRRYAAAALGLFMVSALPALLSDSLAGAVVFGMVMNLLCGVISGAYLYAAGRYTDGARSSLVFGGGYAVATLAVGVLALIGHGALMHGRFALLTDLVLTGIAVAMAFRLKMPGEKEGEAEGTGEGEAPEGRTLLFAGGVLVLISMVKNLGFGFPSEDIAAGMLPELSRIPYAAGLAAAAAVNDRSRRNGALCTLCALSLPFIMLGLTAEPVSHSLFWGLEYLFYGFFSVFRAVLFMDLARRTGREELASFGLLFGRLGDVAGTGVCLLLSGSRALMIGITAGLFFPSVFLLLHLYRTVYEPKGEEAPDEQEIFEAFCLHHDLSAREKDVLKMMVSGQTNGEIAEALFITESTVKYHVRNILQKTGCRNRSELTKKYTQAMYPRLKAAETEAGAVQ